jgi:hypothetical protein
MSSVGIATDYELENRGLILDRVERFFVSYSFQIASGVHPVSYPMGADGSSPGNKADVA